MYFLAPADSARLARLGLLDEVRVPPELFDRFVDRP
jgi:hypothetical protein